MKDLPTHVTRALRDAAVVGFLGEIEAATRTAIVATFQRKPPRPVEELESLIVLGIGEEAARAQIEATEPGVDA